MKTATAALENNIGSGWWAKRQQQMVAKVLAPLSHAKRGVLRLTLPNGNSIEFGEHPCDHFNPVIVLHNWKAVRKPAAQWAGAKRIWMATGTAPTSRC